ncbi:hypothetical protein [Nocardia seriolae]|nr:hypothetical protein [Nocardia seriolae]GEM28451.1 hypothetical protein NS2_66900 [Nocardia seriolae NBRC 15557]MTK40121.1 hypothetical protein [Nocardia seriolae]QOW31086.1 hypothetical protein IMZ23_23530 [Nocardia seriolae]QUN18302.1 hypothetical protein KEC46_02245 [Nocardia seriolae]WKY50599.1 hypothetical protein Q5P07_26805 [Nocardia seriolae]
MRGSPRLRSAPPADPRREPLGDSDFPQRIKSSANLAASCSKANPDAWQNNNIPGFNAQSIEHFRLSTCENGVDYDALSGDRPEDGIAITSHDATRTAILTIPSAAGNVGLPTNKPIPILEADPDPTSRFKELTWPDL